MTVWFHGPLTEQAYNQKFFDNRNALQVCRVGAILKQSVKRDPLNASVHYVHYSAEITTAFERQENSVQLITSFNITSSGIILLRSNKKQIIAWKCKLERNKNKFETIAGIDFKR